MVGYYALLLAYGPPDTYRMVAYYAVLLAYGPPNEGEQCYGFLLTLCRTVCSSGTR
jgi:hypothetical protein